MIVIEDDIVYSFTFIGNKGFVGHPEFLSARNTFGVKLLKYCLFAWFRAFTHSFLCFLCFCQSAFVRDLLNLLRTLSRIVGIFDLF